MNAKTQYKITGSDMEIILCMVRTGTLAEAGVRLGVDGSTVFRAIQRIEKGLHQRLFERSKTGYRATELALQLAQHGERIEVELEAARNAAQNASASASGIVRITTTDTVLHGLVLPVLQSLGAAHPLLQFELSVSNELASLTRRDADIAIRATKQPPDHLIGKQLGPLRVALFAPKHGKARSSEFVDLSQCAWVAPDDSLPQHPSVKWRQRHYPKVVPQFRLNSIVSVTEAVAAGLGVGVLPLFLTRGRKDLVQLSAPLDECETQLWLLTHTESRHLRRVSTVVDHLVENLQLV